MKLLLDQNLSYKLCDRLIDIFPEIRHIKEFGYENKPDHFIWEFAKKENYCIVSKDSDFLDKSIVLGFPPKFIWLKIGNSTVKEIEGLLRKNLIKVNAFINDIENAVLILY